MQKKLAMFCLVNHEQSDKDGKTIQQGKRVKKRSHKVKNYDEGVFDITKKLILMM